MLALLIDNVKESIYLIIIYATIAVYYCVKAKDLDILSASYRSFFKKPAPVSSVYCLVKQLPTSNLL